jgi:hypothetical protein
MMRKHNPQIQEDGFYWLRPHAAEHIDALIEEFHHEKEHGLRCWLLELIGEDRSEKVLDLLRGQLASPDESLRDWAIRGLTQLGTKAARQALFDAGVRPQHHRT